MGGAESASSSGDDPNLPPTFIELRQEARTIHGASRGVPQVAILRLYDNNVLVWSTTDRFQGGDHTEANLIHAVENNFFASLLNSGTSHVYLYTENSPCCSRGDRGVPCMQLLINFARNHPLCIIDVGFQRPFGSHFANDEFRMSNFLEQLRAYNHTNGLPEPNIPSNLRFYRVNLGSAETHHVHDEL